MILKRTFRRCRLWSNVLFALSCVKTGQDKETKWPKVTGLKARAGLPGQNFPNKDSIRLFSQTFSRSLYLIAGSVQLCECFLHISVGAHFGLQVFKTSSVFWCWICFFLHSIGQLFFHSCGFARYSTLRCLRKDCNSHYHRTSSGHRHACVCGTAAVVWHWTTRCCLKLWMGCRFRPHPWL